MIDSVEAEKGNALTWKIAFWGNYEDERTLFRIKNSYPRTIEQLCDERQWHIIRRFGIKR